MFMRDGFHLSEKGAGCFRNNYQEQLKTFIKLDTNACV